MKKSLIYLDKTDIESSTDLLEAVRQIYPDGGYETYAFCMNCSPDGAMGKFDYVICVQDERIHEYDIRNLTGCLEEVNRTYNFDSILIPATYRGRMLAPRLAMRLGVGLVADVTGISGNQDVVELIRPAFSGKLFAAVVNDRRKPLMLSVRPNVFTYASGALKETRLLPFRPVSVQASRIRLTENIEKEKARDIRESKILVSGGGGTIDHFDRLYALAEALGGMVSASRRIVDSGIAPRSIQVGHSGKTVSPKLYIALGIFGSVQHMEGLKNVENIISVNTNRNAPICSVSDIVVEGDSKEFIQKMVHKINKLKNIKSREAES